MKSVDNGKNNNQFYQNLPMPCDINRYR